MQGQEEPGLFLQLEWRSDSFEPIIPMCLEVDGCGESLLHCQKILCLD